MVREARPTLIGWRSISHEASGQSEFHTDSRRFEVATSCIPLCAGLEQSLQLLEAEGTAQERLALIQLRSGYLWQGLQANSRARTLLKVPPPAGLVSFELSGKDPESVVKRLGEKGIWLRSLDDPHSLRACTHITTTEAEIEQLLGALQTL